MKNKQIYLTAIIWLILDQLSKILVRSYLVFAKEYTLISKFFSFYYVENEVL